MLLLHPARQLDLSDPKSENHLGKKNPSNLFSDTQKTTGPIGILCRGRGVGKGRGLVVMKARSYQ